MAGGPLLEAMFGAWESVLPKEGLPVDHTPPPGLVGGLRAAAWAEPMAALNRV